MHASTIKKKIEYCYASKFDSKPCRQNLDIVIKIDNFDENMLCSFQEKIDNQKERESYSET
jgi:hypothetical protein